MKKIFLLLLPVLAGGVLTAQQDHHKIKNLKITILSTMLAQQGMGEWGFSALVEADSIKILFDAGGHDRTVLDNSKELNIDLSNVHHLILSHNHSDHTQGWLTLRNKLSAINPKALSITHVAPGIFDTRVSAKGEDNNSRKKDSLSYIGTGGKIILHNKFVEIFPGIYLTGNVPRVHPEKNYPVSSRKKDAAGRVVEDDLPEDMSLIISTEKGLVLLSGCGHSGIINTITHTQKNLKRLPVFTAIGGFHLLNNPDEQIKWTAGQLKQAGIKYFMGAHCTGIEPVYQIREWAGLKRGECVVGAVGASFELSIGFNAGSLAK
jgi:7,8-dihydropterin-6-yl-methyl-4-(beta-D-ribofuranosyl)aminobenzene 5'-phosphate synthase